MAVEKNHRIICSASRQNFGYLLLWPSFKEELHPSKKYYIKLAIYFLATSGFFLSFLMHFIVTVVKKLDLPVSEDISATSSLIAIYYMTTLYVKNQPKITRLMRDLSNFETFEKPQGFDQKDKFLNFLSNASFVYGTSGVFLYCGIKFFTQKSKCEEINKQKNLTENCGFAGPVWTPFKTDHFLVYYSFFFYTLMCCQFLMKPNFMITFNAYEISQHVILKINQLTKMLRECFDNDNYEVSKRKLTKCILLHIEILKLAARINQNFANIMLTHIAITAIVFACIEKQFVDGDRLCAMIHLSGWIITLILACVSGQLLINASESIPEAIWASMWYTADVRLRKDILFMLAKSQKILYLNVGAFDILSFELLVAVTKMSYSILCLLTS